MAPSKPLSNGSSLEGQLLIAMPGMSDPRFERALILLCAHSEDGAMGIRVNDVAPRLTFADVIERLDLMPPGETKLPPSADAIIVHNGGPVETGRGFVLHSADYASDASTLVVDDEVCLTATLDILRAIVDGTGPKRALLALGYAGWGPGQLEAEIMANGWLNCPAAPDLLFDLEVEGKYDVAMSRIGVDPAMLSDSAGHA